MAAVELPLPAIAGRDIQGLVGTADRHEEGMGPKTGRVSVGTASTAVAGRVEEDSRGGIPCRERDAAGADIRESMTVSLAME